MKTFMYFVHRGSIVLHNNNNNNDNDNNMYLFIYCHLYYFFSIALSCLQCVFFVLI